MGSEFFWFLDILIIAIIAVSVFSGIKKGAVSVLISAVSAIVAFIIAFSFCGVVSQSIYDHFISDKIEESIKSRLGNSLDKELIEGLSNVDMMKTKSDGVYLSEMSVDYDERGNAVLDLSAADLTETGIDKIDLTAFGIKDDFDWSLVKAGHISLNSEDVKKYGIGHIVLAKIITIEMTSGNAMNALEDVGDKLGSTISPSLRSLGNDLSSGSRDAVYSFVVSIITLSDGTIGDRVMSDIIKPTVMIPLKAVVFCLIFTIIVAILSIIANASKVINKIPIVSGVNEFLGAILGLLEGIITIIIICIIVRFLISICGGSIVFINEATIQKTFIFKYLYAFDPLSLLGLGK